MQIRRAADRGYFDHGWLKTHHTFSFADYHDPAHMGFSALRVINDDWIAPHQGFGTHGHRDMEILTYMVSGVLTHRDSMGHEQTLVHGEVQRMSAGTGVRHSEINEGDQPVRLLQIWLLPEEQGINPRYGQKRFDLEAGHGHFTLLASRDGAEGSLTIHQDVRVYRGLLDSGQALEQALDVGRRHWIQMVDGTVHLNGELLHPGDGIALIGETSMMIEAQENAELLWFDLA